MSLQVDASTTRRSGGPGSGLVIAQRPIGLMGDRIDVTGTPGVGSVFAIDLPLETAELPAARPAAQMLALIRAKRVLIADDSETNPAIVAERLPGWQLTPDLARHPNTALALLPDGHVFDAIITDFKMPGRTGLPMATCIRQAFGGAAARRRR